MRLGDGLACAGALADAMRSQYLSPSRLRARQQALLQAQLRHASAAVPFYRHASLTALSRLPLLRRETIQADPEAFLAQGMDRSGWHTSHTSGSTGSPLATWFDPACWREVKVVLKVRRLLAWGWRPGQRLVIVEAVAPEGLAAHARSQALPGEGWLGGRRYLSVFEPPESHLDAYRPIRPHFIYGFPSYFLALAECWDASMRRQVPLRALMTSAEWVHPRARRRLEEIFRVPVLDVYGSTECKEIAWQCPTGGGYHINMESVLVELVDEAGREVPPGRTGDVVVTTLTNRAMPLLRYATGDRARRLPGCCPCGRGLERLEGIEGRVADYLVVPGLGQLSPYELTTMIEADPSILRYHVTHRRPDALEVQVVLRPGADGQAVEAVRARLTQRFAGQLRISVEAVSSLPRQASGKTRCVQVAEASP
jgi:phenylacetate-CoA ligase